MKKKINVEASEEEEARLETRRHNLVSEIQNKSNAIAKIMKSQASIYLKASFAFIMRFFRLIEDTALKNKLLEKENKLLVAENNYLKEINRIESSQVKELLLSTLTMTKANDQNTPLMIGQVVIYNKESIDINAIKEQ